MNVLVLNGSPRGNSSVTLQTVLFIQKKYPQDSFEILNVAQQLRSVENNFEPVMEKMLAADIILFSYPVYTFMAPGQLHRFIDLLKEQINSAGLKDKYVTQITTSKHFFDVTAQDYIRENCQDLKMHYLYGLTADMDDLPTKRGQAEALDFWRYIRFQMGQEAVPEVVSDKRIALICDLPAKDIKLRNRVEEFKAKCPYRVDEINLQDIRIDGGCLGCLKCVSDGKCVYKDGFSELLREKILTADATVYAFTVKNHSAGTNFKYFDDRQFCNGHRILSKDKPVAYIINGDYFSEHNLETVIRGKSSVGHNIITYIAVDKDGEIGVLLKNLSYCLEKPILKPQNFYGVGGTKIFRDLIYVMGGYMSADYKFYKDEGFFNDLPHKQRKRRMMMKFVGMLMRNKKIMEKAGVTINAGMLAPYKKVLEE